MSTAATLAAFGASAVLALIILNGPLGPGGRGAFREEWESKNGKMESLSRLPRSGTVVPFKLIKENPILPIMLDGDNHLTCWIVDSGYGYTAVDDDLAERLNLKSTGRMSVQTLQTDSLMSTKLPSGFVFDIDPSGATAAEPVVEIPAHSAVVRPLSSTLHNTYGFGRDCLKQGGILGITFLRHFATRLDYKNKTLTFYDPHRFHYPPPAINKMPDVLLIHVPKTAGTTVKYLLHDHDLDYKELHFNRRMQCQPCHYLDEILRNPQQKVVLTWRHPVEHVWSTFHFYQEYPHFHYPTTLEEFIEHPDLQNQQAAFLVKENFLTAPDLNEATVEKIRALIDRPNTLCFVQDYFTASLERLADFLELPVLASKGDRSRRFNFNKPPSATVSLDPRTVEKLKTLNSVDLALYEHMVQKYYSTASPEKSPILPSHVPVEYPMNLVAGKVSLDRYREDLKTIRDEILVGDRPPTVATYIEAWLEKFSTIVAAEITTLEKLKTFLSDDSEKVRIKTTSF